jgi:bacterioferritin
MRVKAGKAVVAALNDILTGELTSVNQYFLHAKMLENWGFDRLAARIRKESIDEMKHADVLIERILYLEGVPNVQKLGRIRIGENVPEILASDLSLEQEAIPRLNQAIALCTSEGDHGTRVLLDEILRSEEEHLDWLETQQRLVVEVGLQNYLAQSVDLGD